MKHLIALTLLAGGTALANTPAPVANVATSESWRVVAKDPQTLVRSLQAMGYQAKLGVDEKLGEPLIDSASSGYNFTIYFDNCTAKKDCRDVMLVTSLAEAESDLAAYNKFNAERRYTRVYRNSKGGATMDMALNLDFDGFSSTLFEDTMKIWIETMDIFFKTFEKPALPAKP